MSLPPLLRHNIAVTDDGIRVHVECECGHYARRAAMKAGNIAALHHYLDHATYDEQREPALAALRERTQ